MAYFSLNWFLGSLAIQFWVAAWLISFGSELRQAWRRSSRPAFARPAGRQVLGRLA